MKYFWIFLCSIVTPFTSRMALAQPNTNINSVYDTSVKSLRGESVDLKQYSGKVALVVNTASNCGFTSQYEGLESLYESFKDQDFVILGFPSNDFGKQEPGSNKEIADFCKLNYGVTFPMFEKNPVKGDNKQLVYKILTEQSSDELQGEIGWNFVKFLVDKNGVPRARFNSITRPESRNIKNEIEKLLNE